MLHKLVPDRIFSSVYEITPELLEQYEIKGVIFDIDNTLTDDQSAEPTEELREFLLGLQRAGISLALVSNNSAERVERFNRSLGFFSTPNAQKPRKKSLLPGLDHLSLPKERVVFVGDQILTDVAAARRNGIRAFLVEPIRPYENPFFYLKRLLEKPFLFAYYRLEKRRICSKARTNHGENQ